MVCKYDLVLFDLDGTLSDSAQGVQDSLEYALKAMGKPVPNLSDRSIYVGPPLLDTFRNYFKLSPEECDKGIALYKQYYETNGILKNYQYNGLEKLISTVRKNGGIAVVSTSKLEAFAYRVLEIIGLDNSFDAVCGSNLDGSRREKADIIRYAMEKVNITDSSHIVLIGDTVFDTIGAAETGCDFIGVTYGFGKKEQMAAKGCTKFSDTVDGLYNFLFE